jgi:hypothetical protein
MENHAIVLAVSEGCCVKGFNRTCTSYVRVPVICCHGMALRTFYPILLYLTNHIYWKCILSFQDPWRHKLFIHIVFLIVTMTLWVVTGQGISRSCYRGQAAWIRGCREVLGRCSTFSTPYSSRMMVSFTNDSQSLELSEELLKMKNRWRVKR